MNRVTIQKNFIFRTLFFISISFLTPFAMCRAAGEHRVDGKENVTSGCAHVGFYLHGGWVFNYPFAPRKWQREDFSNMFTLLNRMGYDTVMLWPLLEAIPMPLSDTDAAELRTFRPTIDDARAAGLRVWLTQCPNLTTSPALRTLPWRERNPYPVMRTIHFDNPADTTAYFEHRAAIMKILNNADGYVTIDGDPGGYASAQPQHFVDVFLHDAATLAAHGERPGKQEVITWLWCGWGTKGVWREPIEPFLRAVYESLPTKMSEPWSILPGRSHRDGHANGRTTVRLMEEYHQESRSTLLLYETVEFEPTPPAAKLQFDLIRTNLCEESANLGRVRGVMANAQQPVMVLPNIWFFVRCARVPAYAAKSDTDILYDFADFLGGDRNVLATAWKCLTLNLSELPADLPARLRSLPLGENAAFIPGGPTRYLDVLAKQVESQHRLLTAMKLPATTDAERAAAVAEGVKAIVSWWQIHQYVGGNEPGSPFNWNYVSNLQRGPFSSWVRRVVPVANRAAVRTATVSMVADVLTESVAEKVIAELLPAQ
jgi:hypothetical protein